MKEELKYGPVMILTGQFRGMIGYYDDDDSENAIVYLGEPFSSETIKIPHRAIKNTDIKNLSLERFIKNNPEEAKSLGVKGN